ncbi:MAG: nucleotidyl transferase AbiEii/AbiGii toxin family protein [Actinomycetia bacterium]|nr:nucleotidyl transferase AbiEii/AbiGii toxin family protein [Actinomycetota bacterium]MCG2794929.1 nucleotidyl transferase AbiEii/AbiGii toxin family protein [Actinomycetes bacterium]
MKGHMSELVQSAPSPLQARNDIREYLQARILGVLQRRGTMIPLAFHGGTALRFLYATARYSEDLDFSLERKTSDYDFQAYLRATQREFSGEGYEVEVKVNDAKTVHSALVRFPGLLYELGLSPHRRETLSVKLEVDTQPPAGAALATTVVRRHLLLRLQHHDRASLLAGKLHAVLQRPYLKGRDLYDLAWYLGDPAWPTPNLVLLNNALRQTGWTGHPLNDRNWRKAMRERLRSVSWERVADDVSPFLGLGADPGILTKDNLMRLLR